MTTWGFCGCWAQQILKQVQNDYVGSLRALGATDSESGLAAEGEGFQSSWCIEIHVTFFASF